MKNFFSINIQKSFDSSANEKNIYKLTDNIELKLIHSGPTAIIDTQDYFYFRFGCMLATDNKNIDQEFAQAFYQDNSLIINTNSGYFGIFFFNKKSATGSVHADRAGIYNVLYQQKEYQLILSNDIASFDLLPMKEVDSAWLAEIVNFRIASGSHTYRKSLKKVPAGQFYQFNSFLETKSCGYYWQPQDRVTKDDLTLEQATERSLELLNEHLSKADINKKKVAVLFSGGVDSTLLAALALQHNSEVVAVTPIFSTGGNPELDIAKKMAKNINIEHQIIEITDKDIQTEFSIVIKCLQQPIRSPHALIFSILIRHLKDKFDAVIFGEGADTIFGYHGIKQTGKRYDKQRKANWLKPLSFLLKPFKSISQIEKLHSLINESVLIQVTNSWPIPYIPDLKSQLPMLESVANTIEMYQWLKLPKWNHSNLDQTAFENLVRKFLIQVGNVDHFFTMGAFANRDGIELICPFMDIELVRYAANFHDKLYFGDDFVKPILRKIGETYYQKELIYLKKKGFPVPHNNWLSGPLLTQATLAKSFITENYGHVASEDNEFVWLVMALQELGIADSLKTYR